MEGFVNTNVNSPFEYGLKHSQNYANYGVDKINPKGEQSKQNQTVNENKSDEFVLGSYSLKNISANDILEGISPDNITENIDKAVVDAVDTITEPNKTNHQKLKTAGVIAASALFVGGAALGLTRGRLSGKIVKRLSEIIEQSNIKIEKLKQNPSASKLEGYYLGFLQGVNKTISKVRGAIFNITPLKDVLFGRVVQDKMGLKKPCEAITNTFRKLSFNTVKSAYKKTGEDMQEMTKLFFDANAKIASGEYKTIDVTVNNKNLANTLNEKVIKINSAFTESFSETQLEKRNQSLIKRFAGLGNKVYDHIYGKIKTFVGDVDEWTTFVPEKLVAKEKAQIMEELNSKKRVITNNPQDSYRALTELITNLEQVIVPTDTASRNSVRNLKTLSEKYVNASGVQEGQNREKIVEKMNYFLHRTMQIAKTETYNPEQAKKVESIARKIGKVLNTDKKGMIEELLTLYKNVLPKEEYLKLKKAADKVSKSLNQAVYKEGFEYVDKSRDLAAGSALTDVAIGMGLPLGTTSVAMSVADTKQKKRSVALKYGLPLLAGVATSTVCTVMLISGGYALMLGSAVSLIGNEIFERVDNYLIKRDAKKAAELNKNKNA